MKVEQRGSDIPKLHAEGRYNEIIDYVIDEYNALPSFVEKFKESIRTFKRTL